MILLLDQNLSRRLVPAIERVFAGSKHLFDVGLEGADDERIWRYARRHGFAIISKDSDFMHRSIARGHPPKIIHVQLGNVSTAAIGAAILARKREIRRFLKNKDESLLVLR